MKVKKKNKRRVASGKGGSPEYLLLRIELDVISPKIWRTLVVRDNSSFLDLHWILCLVMGWRGSHCPGFSNAEMRMVHFFGEPIESDELDAAEVMVSEVLKKAGDHITYLYDFGDGWEHQVEVVKILTEQQINQYPFIPICLDGENACPPDDCGSYPGYAEVLEALKNPNSKKEEVKSRAEWLNGLYPGYNPRVFSVLEVNNKLLFGPDLYWKYLWKMADEYYKREEKLLAK